MRAIQIAEHGGPEVLELVDLDPPRPGPTDLLVDVAAAGINFIDIYRRSGAYDVPTPFVAGLEGAGTVTAVGAAVHGVAVGDRVAWKEAPGSCAEQAVVAADEAVPVPDGVSEQIAAAVMLQGLTAHYLACSLHPVQDGDWVVVHAAAGGVGALLTQIVKIRGGHVLATASTPEKQNRARAVGADEVCSYDGFADAARDLTDGAGVAAVYDGVGRDTFDDSLRALRVRGTMVLFGAASGPVPPVDPQRLNSGGSLFLTRPTLAHYTRDRAELVGRTDELFGWLTAGRLDVAIGGRYPLGEAAQAMADLAGRRTTGKLLLLPR